MTEYGKHGKPGSPLSTLPLLLGNPFGITTFPRPRLLEYSKLQQPGRPESRPFDRKGVGMEVLGPRRGERSSTLRLFSPAWSRTAREMRLIGVVPSNLAAGWTVLCFGQNADGWVLGAG
jgi:hypothetical protein